MKSTHVTTIKQLWPVQNKVGLQHPVNRLTVVGEWLEGRQFSVAYALMAVWLKFCILLGFLHGLGNDVKIVVCHKLVESQIW